MGTPIFMSDSTDTKQATNAGSPTPNNSIWIAVGVSIGVFWLIVMAVIVYCVIKHRQDKNRYVLLELDDDQEAMP
jgi:heme/copper-type cytochrome/quinol oxidase subunit 2